MRMVCSCLALLVITASFAPAQNESATAVVCKEIVKNSCEGADTTFPNGVGKLYGFSQVLDVPDKIVHVWYYKDRELGRFAMTAPNAPRWRTWSNVTVAKNMLGPWKLEVRDSKGKVLATFPFKIE
jgi:hypothetical protein